MRFQSDVRLVSDNQWSFDFREFADSRPDRFLESSGFATRHFGSTGRHGLFGSIAFADDLQSPDDLDRDRFLLQRVPDIQFRELSAPISQAGPGELFVSLDTRYTHFRGLDRAERHFSDTPVVDDIFLDTGIDALPNGYERDGSGRLVPGDGSLDDAAPGPEGDGRFQEGEPLVDSGHRVVLNPRIAYPFRLADRIEVLPEASVHQTLYQTRRQGFSSRTLATASVRSAFAFA